MLGLRLLPVMIVVALAVGAVTGCSDDEVRTVPNPSKDGSTPTMVTTAVDTYVSDSGYVKYHAVTDVWEMYDDTDTPYWWFPRPLVIDTYLPGMKPNAHVECDSALYYTQRRLFRFDGNVVAVNVARDTFLTQQLYWDQAKTQFYTDSFIHIVKSDRVIEGYGFVANERMTEYSINRPTAIMPASALRGNGGGESRAVPGEDAEMDGMTDDDPLSRPAPVPASVRGPRPATGMPGTRSADGSKTVNNNEATSPNLKR